MVLIYEHSGYGPIDDIEPKIAPEVLLRNEYPDLMNLWTKVQIASERLVSCREEISSMNFFSKLYYTKLRNISWVPKTKSLNYYMLTLERYRKRRHEYDLLHKLLKHY